MLDRGAFECTVDAFVDRNAELLRSLVGRRIEASWLPWDEEDDSWFAEEAVVIAVGGLQLEVVFNKLDEIAMTWGQIDVAQRPAFVADWGPEFRLAWRSNAHPALLRAVGQEITAVDVVTYCFRTEVFASRDSTEVGDHSEAWLLSGLEFSHTGGVLSLFNALDEAGISDERADEPDLRRVRL